MEIGPGVTINKNKFFSLIGYEPHPAQAEFHDASARFRTAVCGRRFGKSVMAARDREVELFKPKTRGWIVGPTYDLADKEFRVIWNDIIVGMGLGNEKDVKRKYNKRQGEMYIEMPWGSIIECRTAADPAKLVGEDLDWIIVSEAAKQNYETWDTYLRPALTDRRGTADFVTTPEGMNWMYHMYSYGRDPRPQYTEYWSQRYPSWLNPFVFPGGRFDPEIELLESTMALEAFKQEIGAEFTAFVGKIYSEFTEETHVTTVEYNPALPNYIAWDWGYANYLCAIEFQVTPRDEIRVWREHFWKYTLLEDAVTQIRTGECYCDSDCVEKPDGYTVVSCFGDAADPEAAAYVTKHLAPCYADNRAKENWREGVMQVKAFLKLHEVGTDDFDRPIEQPNYLVDHSCRKHIFEMLNYRVKKNPESGVEHNARGVALKKDDHSCDAMRYALMHLYVIGGHEPLTDVGNFPNSPVVGNEKGFFSGLEPLTLDSRF